MTSLAAAPKRAPATAVWSAIAIAVLAVLAFLLKPHSSSGERILLASDCNDCPAHTEQDQAAARNKRSGLPQQMEPKHVERNEGYQRQDLRD